MDVGGEVGGFGVGQLVVGHGAGQEEDELRAGKKGRSMATGSTSLALQTTAETAEAANILSITHPGTASNSPNRILLWELQWRYGAGSTQQCMSAPDNPCQHPHHQASPSRQSPCSASSGGPSMACQW